MLAIDTNVVVRILTNDHPKQCALARRLIEANDIFVGDTVWLESEWVLRSVYAFDALSICRGFRAFAGLPGVSVEDPGRLARCLRDAENGMDFADALHLAHAEGCDAFVSFDAKLVAAAARSTSSMTVRSL